MKRSVFGRQLDPPARHPQFAEEPADAEEHAAGVVAHEETQAMYAAEVASQTATKVQALVPTFQRSIFHSPESQSKKTWNNLVDTNPAPGIVKV